MKATRKTQAAAATARVAPSTEAEARAEDNANIRNVHDASPRLMGDEVDLKGSMLNWHHELTQVTGGMILSYKHGRVRRSEALKWAATLRRASQEIEQAVRAPGG